MQVCHNLNVKNNVKLFTGSFLERELQMTRLVNVTKLTALNRKKFWDALICTPLKTS